VHERALTRDLLRRVEEVARAGGATRVTRVSVRLGALAHLTPELFEEAARGTIAEGAELEALVDGGGADAHARDVVLDAVEVEVPEPAAAL
jgi:hydrogenase nickel incorporation protein HypA/HybF